MVTKLDRFCRTVTEGLRYVEELHRRGVIIHILNMGLVEDTPVGKMLLTNLFTFAEFERAMIIERTQAGKAISRKKEGFREGRPPKFTRRQMDHAIEMLQTRTMKEVVDITRISESTIKRELRKRRGDDSNKNKNFEYYNGVKDICGCHFYCIFFNSNQHILDR